MSEQTAAPNPYQVSGPVDEARLFFGRASFFVWIEETVAAIPPRQMMVLSGPAQVGKSSALRHIEANRREAAVLPIYVDLPQISIESLSLFYQNLAEITVAALAPYHFEFAALDRASFVNDPVLAFKQQVILPALDGVRDRKVLFLIDGIDPLMGRIEEGFLNPGALQELAELLQNDSRLYTLFSIESLARADPGGPLAFLHDAHHYELGPLDRETGVALIRDPVRYTIVRDVAQYIYDLAGGYPRPIQQICHALYERQLHYDLQQITIADVAAVWRGLQAQNKWGGLEAEELPTYILQKGGGGSGGITLGSGPRSGLSLFMWLGGMAGIILILALAFNGWQNRNQETPYGQMGASAVEDQGKITPAARLRLAAADETVATATATETKVPTATPSAAPTYTPEPSFTPLPTATPTATPLIFPQMIERDIDGMPMMYVPAGAFIMGASEEDIMAGADERPQHHVQLDGFYIDQYEVNVSQYAAFLNELGTYLSACDRVDCALPRGRVGYTGYLVEEDEGGGTAVYEALPGYADYPMNHVSWHGARAYCEYAGGRLPTEAEWEYAARGGDARIYPWGNEPPEKNLAVFQSQSFSELLPVDALPDGASPFGVYGMAGSLWEWTADWYGEDYYEDSPAVNPTGPVSGPGRVQRGGAWPNNNQMDRIRTTNRTFSEPVFISSAIGFRCVQPLPESSP